MKILAAKISPPSSVAKVAPLYDDIVLKGLATNPATRFTTAREMSIAIGKAGPRADAHEVAAWLEGIAGEALSSRANAVSAIESAPSFSAPQVEADAATRSDLARDPQPATRGPRAIALGAVVATLAGAAIFAGVRYRHPTEARAPVHEAVAASVAVAPPASTRAEPVVTAPTTSVTASVSAAVASPPRPARGTARKPAASATPQKLPDFL